ncbi:TIM44-like domain-containing protein [Allorhizobium sonneratiae]|uniref:TIM44-like domain-containing protein n=1 Tax=Allorhizobium sonneratiae TaxID=2934936 RepID=UPI003B84A36C
MRLLERNPTGVKRGPKSALWKIAAVVLLGLSVALTATDFAEARKASSFSGFGSRGSRTWSAPSTTTTAPSTAAPIQRSTTPNYGAQPGMAQTGRGGFFGGSLIGGLLMGGLFGMMLGHGFFGGGGLISFLFQLLLIAGVVMLVRRLFSASSAARGGAASMRGMGGGNGFPIPPIGSGARAGPVAGSVARGDEIGITPQDLDHFEALLKEMQRAYSAEDYNALRRITTPEAMNWLTEELQETARRGLRNEVSGVTLLQGDVADAWREGQVDYATVAMRYEAVDVMRERESGRVVEGDPAHAGQSVEVWTFLRRAGAPWVISAIQSS